MNYILIKCTRWRHCKIDTTGANKQVQFSPMSIHLLAVFLDETRGY